MKKNILCSLLVVAVCFALSCKKDEYQAPGITGVATDTIVLNIGDKMVLAPGITNLKGNSYLWQVNGKQVAVGQVNYTFEATTPGNYTVTINAGNKGGSDEQAFHILVEGPISLTIPTPLSVSMCNIMEIAPYVTGPSRTDYQYVWSIGDSVIGKTRTLNFISPFPGTYALTLSATAGKQTATATRMITVKAEPYLQNAWGVLEFAPAPGRLHNWAVLQDKALWDLGYESPLPYNDFLAKASQVRKTDLFSSLFVGAWGGYATFKFDHTVVNVPGKTDIELTAYYSIRDLPGVYVAYDRNKNGKPEEDEWYEIKTEDYGLEDYTDYAMTFTYDSTVTDARRVYVYYSWQDNQPGSVKQQITSAKTFTSAMTYAGTFSDRGFFPGLHMIDLAAKRVGMLEGWKTSFTRTGKRVTKNVSGAAAFFQKLNIDIDQAVNSKGESVALPGIDFIKVRKTVYPLQQLAGYTELQDFNLDEGRMLQVRSILDKHIK